MEQGKPTLHEVRIAVAEVIGLPPEQISDGANLVQLGLKSLHLMQLINTWRRAGLRADFRRFAEEPQVESWWKILYVDSMSAN